MATVHRILVERKDNELYVGADGWMLGREWQGCSPNGNAFAGRWVLRDGTGAYVDHDQYRTDLAERNKIGLRDLTS